MTNKIQTLYFTRLPNAAHYTFFAALNDLITSSPATLKNALAAYTPDLVALLAEERQNIDWIRRSEYTALIAASDHRIDAALSGLKAQTVAAQHSLHKEIAQAASRIMMMLKNYKDVVRKPYLQELGDIQGILDNLNGAYATDVKTTNNTGWVTELQAAFDEFKTLYDERNIEETQKPEKTFREVRRAIETVYRQIADVIDANATLNTSPDFAAFIKHINPEIEKLNAQFHHGKHDIAACQPAPIERQQYTGKPVTPTPDVLFVTSEGTIRLEPGKDFNFAYRNNVDVGNADCIVRGINRYKGSKTVTFVISR